jgi:hypothetical protein
MAEMADIPSVVDEFATLQTGDARLDARVRLSAAALEADPSASFPVAMGSVAAREGFYRLVNNESVQLEKLIAAHRFEASKRMSRCSARPIIAIDKTRFLFEGDGEREGLERVSNHKHGFESFFALALTLTRRTHGIVGVKALDGHGQTAAEEWAEFVEQSGHAAVEAGQQPIFVMDREADAYALFSALLERRQDFVVRASWDRLVKECSAGSIQEPFRDVAARAPLIFTRDVQLAPRSTGGRTSTEKSKHPPRLTRKAVLEVRACTVVLLRPKVKKLASLPTELRLQLVYVSEPTAPEGQPAVEWFLITPLAIADASSVELIVDAYRARWIVEEYFKALKTGCAYEQRQLESRHALLNALGLLIPIAWRLLELRTIADDQPELPAEEVLDADELHVLRKLSRDVKLGPAPTIHEALLAIASIGGHIKQNGRPGWQVLYRGLRKLLSHVEGYRIAQAEM